MPPKYMYNYSIFEKLGYFNLQIDYFCTKNLYKINRRQAETKISIDKLPKSCKNLRVPY